MTKVIPQYELDAVREYVEARCEHRRCSDRYDRPGQRAAQLRQGKIFANQDRRVWASLDIAKQVMDRRLDVTWADEAMPEIIDRLT